MNRLLALLLRIAVMVWLGGSLWLFLSPSFATHLNANVDFLGRALEALRTGLVQTPRLMLTGGFILASQLDGLVQDILIDLNAAQPGGQQPINLPGLSVPALVPLLRLALSVVVTLSIVQFVLFFVIFAATPRYIWRYPGIPYILPTLARLIYYSLAIIIIALMAESAWSVGVIPTVIVLATSALIMKLPLFSGLPLWLLEKVFMLPPSRLLRLPRVLKSRPSFSQSSSASNESGGQERTDDWRETHRHSRSRDRGTAGGHGDRSSGSGSGGRGQDQRNERGSSSSNQGKEQKGRRTAPPADAAKEYSDACAVFDLVPGNFDQATLKKRYREVARGNHPDASGSTYLMKMTNSAYELIKARHGWK
ncbi:MAG: hypothetical protein ABJF07_09725 [Nisaea sp.]|uniref:J domain-containing protein n=1 Tax=Nisaea sp. TaxID=2024842 RepID=UPI0032676BF5